MSRDYVFIPQSRFESQIHNGALVRYQQSGNAYKEISRSPLVKSPKNLAGWRSPLPYKCTVTDYNPLYGYLERRLKNDWEETFYLIERYEGGLDLLYSGVMPSLSGSDMEMPGSNDTNRAEVECLLKVRDMSINLLQVFAERQKTIDLIFERTTRLVKAYKAAKRGRFRDAAKALGVDKKGKKTASSWLELQYGWLPLMSDIYGGYEAITGRRAQKGMLFNVKRTVNSSKTRTVTQSTETWNSIANIQTKQWTKVSLWYTVEYEALAEASKVGLLNPLEIAWELTPWSFVLDWIVPVGNVLGALSATSGCTFKGGTLTRGYDATLDCQVIPRTTHSFGQYIERSGDIKGGIKVFNMDRQVYTGSPTPTLYVKNPLSVGHALNAIALLRGFFK